MTFDESARSSATTGDRSVDWIDIAARGIGRGLLVAASVGLAACASSPTPSAQASDYRPVPRSTLVSRTEPTFLQAQTRQGEQWATVLARRDPAGAPVPVAVTRYASDGGAALVSVQLLSDPSGPALDVLALEQLYGLMFRHDAQGRYCLAVGRRPCDAARQGISHAALLRELADARERAATRAGRPFAMIAWRGVSMRAAAAPASDPNDVAVRVSDQRGPLSGITVYFNRAPHSGCAAKTSEDGVAACRLVDQHSDGTHADDDAHSQVVVTYPGDVGAERVLLPTTFVLPATGADATGDHDAGLGADAARRGRRTTPTFYEAFGR